MLVAWGGDAGTFRSRTGWEGTAGGPLLPRRGPWPVFGLSSPFPVPGALPRAPLPRRSGRVCAGSAPPRPPGHSATGAQGTSGLSPTRVPSQMQPQDPRASAVPRLPGGESACEPPPPPPPHPRCYGQGDAAVPRMSVWELRALTFPSACSRGEAEGLKAARCAAGEPRGGCGFLPPQTPGKPGGGHAGHPLSWPCLAEGSTARRDAGRRLLPA